MVWDEDKVREWSDVAREAQKGNYEFNFGYLFGFCVELKRNMNSFLFIRNGSLKGEWRFREISSPTNIGRLLSPKT